MNKPSWMDSDLDDDDDLDLDDLTDDDLEDDPTPADDDVTDGGDVMPGGRYVTPCARMLRAWGIKLPVGVRQKDFMVDLFNLLMSTQPPSAASLSVTGSAEAITIRTPMSRVQAPRTLSTEPIFDPSVERRKREERAGNEIAAMAGAPPRRAGKPSKRKGRTRVPSTAAQDAGTELATLAGARPRKPAPPAKAGRTSLFETPGEELARLAGTPDYRAADVL